MVIEEAIHFILLHPIASGLILGILGTLYLFWGWQLYRFTLVMSATILGGLLGRALGRMTGYYPLPFAAIGMLAFGLLAVPFEKVAVFMLGGLCGAGIGIMLTGYPGQDVVNVFWGMLGFIVFGGLAVRFFRPIVVLASSSLGAYCVTYAFALFLGKVTIAHGGFDRSLLVLYVCLLFLGIISQYSRPGPAEKEHPPEPPPVQTDSHGLESRTD